jgi:hypothetical protein
MGKMKKRGHHEMVLHRPRSQELQRRRQVQIALQRVRQGCYGICAGSFVAIPAAMLGEHSPAVQTTGMMGAVALLAASAGLLLEVVENRIFPGGMDDA